MHDERSFVSLKGWDTWSRWDVYTWLMVFVALIFQISRLPALPIFMDCYYHLAVMRGFQEAGGWVGHAFWEYVPSGRPHLYPPFFHILEMGVSALGIGPIDVARFFQFLIYPLFLGGMATCSPVFGLRPFRAFRSLTSKLPKPEKVTFSPAWRAPLMPSIREEKALADWR